MTDGIAAWLTAIWDEDAVEAESDKYVDDCWWMNGPFEADFVKARIAADRQILALHGPEYDDIGSMILGPYCKICRYDEGLDKDPYPCTTLRLLALPHATRPGYNEQWRP